MSPERKESTYSPGLYVVCKDCGDGKILKVIWRVKERTSISAKIADMYAQTHLQMHPDHNVFLLRLPKKNGG